MVGRRGWHFFRNNEFSGDGRPEVLPIAGGLGAISSWGRGGNDCGHNQDGQAVFWQKN